MKRLIIFLFLPLNSFGQLFNLGDTVKIFSGSRADGSFENIYTDRKLKEHATKQIANTNTVVISSFEIKKENNAVGVISIFIDNETYFINSMKAHMEKEIQAPELAPEIADFTFVEVFDSLPMKKDEIFKSALAATAEIYKDSKTAIQYSDMGTGTIMLKAVFKFNPGPNYYVDLNGKVEYELKIEVKDFKYRLTFSNFEHQFYMRKEGGGDLGRRIPLCGSTILSGERWLSIKDRAMNEVEVAMKEYAQRIPNTKTDSDW